MEERFDIEEHMSKAVEQVGGTFKLTSLLEKRMKSLLMGSQKLISINAGGVLETAFAEAARLADLPQPAFHNTKTSVRAACVAYIRETLEGDMRRTTRGPTS